ncbi:MAG: 50S ribosomal protein L10 [Gracilimonas sp.]|uniref:Large ribosomal subunit protein uL10 n=1 Tax=Gracilimonas sediminicola TaxID=2952158 RepID=A0A9X2L3Q3_9BACT|nr:MULTISPECIES: 50S ribosomal protein L10 [Gracilimonas]MBO6585275.1 50S ribosomal protein L10 [Gracilimonas sp.]MBO6616271.1 50S ribosomal protein L10 [Gracilimonas sp.]MCP9291722.1 50S ribosomal protein L10 [Gracilimonas sediminicola]
MPTAEKRVILDELTEKLKSSSALYIANYSGMSVPEVNELRGAFRKGDIRFKVYKNKLVKLAMEEVGGYDEIIPALVEQNAFAFVEEELSAPAKVLKDFIKDNNKPEFKAAIVDGDFYGADKLDVLAAMKSKNEIVGDILGLLMAPLSNVVGALESQGSNLVGAVKTIAEKGEE